MLLVQIVIASSLTLAGPPAQAPMTSPPPSIIEHGPRGSRKIALTFDACATHAPAEYDERVIETLLRENVPATLFLSGRWVQKNYKTAQFLVGLPQFEIANHTYSHPHLTALSDDHVHRELVSAQTVLERLTGKLPRYFRPPYGEVDERVARIAATAGLATVQFDLASGDPDPTLTASRIARAVLKNAQGGSIVVFHMNRKGVHTAEMLPAIISGLRQKGFTLVTVGELLQTQQRTAKEE